MRVLRSPVCVGLLLVILAAGSCREGSREGSSLLELLMDSSRAARQQQADHSSTSVQQQQQPQEQQQHEPPKRNYSVETTEGNEVNKSYQHDQVLVFPRDLRQKEKFLKHLTDYKRCARLLTRLAGSQRCSEG
ncbi:ALK and LTK ligand 2-like isoform X4 [Astyanax mexicanus]|uniref:ALK and LTK ligand 2-like isoform X4 n=1 Tax=Astyanax mexicanus TaxID=7994 RepID=A0A8T2LC37_ASTMX|nr:ALK and LTK ligand 2-like isoform X4 [Astyanax mexicanus]